MKRNLSTIGSLLLGIIFLASFSLRENPQDPPRGKKGEKHIKLVTVDETGKKTVMDTIIKGENVFVFNGDTIGGEKELKWISEEDFDFDMDMDFDIEVEETADGKVIIMKSGKGGAPMIKQFKIDGDSNQVYRVKMKKHAGHDDHDVMMWSNDEGNSEMIIHAPHMAGAPLPPKMMIMKKERKENVIDLSDPGIIKYDKKELKDGTEKITIVRHKPSDKNIEIHEEIIIHGAGDHSMMLHEEQGKKVKKVKVIKDDQGNISIYEDGKVKKIKAGEGENAFISEEGDVFHIKEIKEGDKKKIEVKIETKEEKENKQ